MIKRASNKDSVVVKALRQIIKKAQPGPILKVYHMRTEFTQQGDETVPSDPTLEDEEVINCFPDQWDIEEGLDEADIAAKYIKDNSYGGGVHPSSSSWHHGLWYSTHENDIYTGDVVEKSFHPEGFTVDHEKKLFDLLQ